MDDIYYIVAHRSQEEIDSFKTRYDVFPAARIPEIFQKGLGFTVTGWKQSHSWGTSHVIYFVDVTELPHPLILRANIGFGKPEVAMKMEKLVTDDVLALGVPTNKVLAVDISRGEFPFDYQIQEVLRGADLEAYFTGTKEQYDQMSFEIGAHIGRYSTLHYQGFGRFDDEEVIRGRLRGRKTTLYEYISTKLEEDAHALVAAGVISSDTAVAIVKRFEEHKDMINIAQGSLVHHDLADHNIMFEGEHITGVFDWEACSVGDPVLDLASCPTWKTFYPREEHLLAGFQSVSPLPEHFEAKYAIYRLRTMLWKMVFAIRAHLVSVERTKKFEDALAPYGLKVQP